ncbi:uncharacterized protein DEA37_0002600 [Paragonimus westermani]|uniref:Uncharacterized protein n=1 Tax=Paragonimus westermani TaxID=34504 RepID=A0A5J4P181_9TREM|nr:uncharacterized protein DEA37_0002600 [Paragonimus westermani]
MFLKTNLFKQFQKDFHSFGSSKFHSDNGNLNKSGESMLWGGIDETENNSGCDLDEEDDYFQNNSFMESTSGGSEDSFAESKWPNLSSYLEVSKKFGRHQPGNGNRFLNIRKNDTHLSDKEVHSMTIKEHAHENPKSPSPSKCNDDGTAASPMLNFLKRKRIVDQIQSPDSRINSSTDNALSPYNQHAALESDASELGSSPLIVDRIDTLVDGNTAALVDQVANNHPENRLKLLYKNLKQETNKFIKWKTYTGLQLEEKDGDLKRADSVIENLRKSNLELQIDLEQKDVRLQTMEQKLNDEKLVVSQMMDGQKKAIENSSELQKELSRLQSELGEKNAELKSMQ